MVRATIVFDNSIASPLHPIEFVQTYYLTVRGLKECVALKVEQGDEELLEGFSSTEMYPCKLI